MWTRTTYSERIVILTNGGRRITFKSSDIMHVREYHVRGGAFEGEIKTEIITKVGNQTQSNNVDQDFDKIIKLLYPQKDGDENEVGTDS